MTNLVTWDSRNSSLPATQPSMQLGTASWHAEPGQATQRFQIGQFLLGNLRKDAPVGLRDDRHVLIASGTRGGKGASFLIPNLCMWPGSVVVIDPKGENAMVTARRRGKGSIFCQGLNQTVRILDPFGVVNTPNDNFSDVKASFNPLSMIRLDDEEAIGIATRIADSLIVSENSNDPFWDESARAFLKALILHVASATDYKPAERNLITVRELAIAGDLAAQKIAQLNSTTGKPISAFLLLFGAMKRNHAFNGEISRTGAMLDNLERTSPRLFNSVAQVARTNTDFMSDPFMKRVLGSTNFQLNELKTNRQGTSLFICLPQRYMETHYRWLRMMTSLIVSEMERVKHQPLCGHKVLMVLDEFPALRRMRVIENAAAQIAGYGVKLVFAVQTLAQLKDIYKDNWETLIANAGIKLFFCNDDHFTREYASKLVGDCHVTLYGRTASETQGVSGSEAYGNTKGTSSSSTFSSNGSSSTWGSSQSSSYTQTSGWNKSQTLGYSETFHRRPLIMPDEVGRLFGDRSNPQALLLLSGQQPISLSRLVYYRDEMLEGTYDLHSDHPTPPTLQAVLELKDRRVRLAEWGRRKRELEREQAAIERELRERRDRRLWKLRAHLKRRYQRNIAEWAFTLLLSGAAGWIGAVLITKLRDEGIVALLF